ncbi:hypothetical protein RDWZM_004627 [Blomia tropicalis]|uniref:Uncharacterized protein n=1 Tax=Blomia tropicalis TaxID=40697 RepID=A0A9Q0RLT6_BLOTA|nr:hypothetical protein RDWZM_004627 [Blomia tropicalis]
MSAELHLNYVSEDTGLSRPFPDGSSGGDFSGSSQQTHVGNRGNPQGDQSGSPRSDREDGKSESPETGYNSPNEHFHSDNCDSPASDKSGSSFNSPKGHYQDDNRDSPASDQSGSSLTKIGDNSPTQISHGGRGRGRDSGGGGSGSGGGYGYGGDRGSGGGRGSGSGGGRGGQSKNFKFPNEPSDSSMTQGVDQKQLIKSKLPPPLSSSYCKEVNLIANFYELKLGNNVIIYHHHVAFKDLAPSNSGDGKPPSAQDLENQKKRFEKFLKANSRQIIRALMEPSNIPYVFDGACNLYSMKRLSYENFEFRNVPLDGRRPGEFLININHVEDINLNRIASYFGRSAAELPEQPLHVLDTIFRSFLIGGGLAVNQRKFFDFITAHSEARHSYVQFVKGYINSVRATEFGIALNIHLKSGCIFSLHLEELMQLVGKIVPEFFKDFRLNENQIQKVNSIIGRLEIFTKYGRCKRYYTVKRLISRTPREMTFIDEKTNKQTNIWEYFRGKYIIKPENYPLVQVMGKDRYLPLEHCLLVPGQFLSHRKIDQDTQQDLLSLSTRSPNLYFHLCGDVVEKISNITNGQPCKFGINSISTKPAQFKGRVLNAPRMKGPRPFHVGIKFNATWALVIFQDQKYRPNYREIDGIVPKLNETGSQSNFHLINPTKKYVQQVQSSDDVKKLFNLIRSECKNIQFVMCGFPRLNQGISPAEIYSIVKFYCDKELGITSQCFDYVKMVKQDLRGYYENIILKLNGKLNGTNLVVDPLDWGNFPFDPKQTMIVGIDVNHPGATERIRTSIAAAVGSYDNLFSKYCVSIRVQKNEGDEIVVQIRQMIHELLKQYYSKNKRYPKHLIIFRDGVSEGQFKTVETAEIPQIRLAMGEFGSMVKMNLTVLVVQKRHHTRFVLTNRDTTNPRKPTYNVPAGTVVDNCINDPRHSIFYLNSHFSSLGTSKPSKYIIMINDLKLSAENLYKIAFYSCHGSMRTNSPISIPNAVRYADLCAYRAKQHMERQKIIDRDPNALGRADRQLRGDDKEVENILSGIVQVAETVRDRFYYC